MNNLWPAVTREGVADHFSMSEKGRKYLEGGGGVKRGGESIKKLLAPQKSCGSATHRPPNLFLQKKRRKTVGAAIEGGRRRGTRTN